MCFTSWQHMFSLKMSQKSRELDLGVSKGQFHTCPNYCLQMDDGQMKSAFGKQLQRITKGYQSSLNHSEKLKKQKGQTDLMRNCNCFKKKQFRMNLYTVICMRTCTFWKKVNMNLTIRVQADRTKTYEWDCTNPCGLKHVQSICSNQL